MLFAEKPVAVVFDWDKTLSPHYMQKPIFEEYGIDEKAFWKVSNTHAMANSHHLGLKCFVEHEYLNTLLEMARKRILKGLDNAKLSELGQRIQIFPGVEDLFRRLKATGAEIYIVTSGIRTMLKDIPFVKECVTEIYGADYADYHMDDLGEILPYTPTKDKPRAIQSLVRVVLPSDKVRIMNEISKGCLQGGFDACVGIKEEDRRIPFKHMIYVGDGVSDIYAFDTVHQGGGYTVGVYNPTDPQFEQIEMLRQDGWLDILGVADFGPTSTVGTWILKKVGQLQFEISKQKGLAATAELEEIRKHAPAFIHSWGKNK
jgi:2-hydroxy-3-keto-5-methylthiopentenyl-1-phosphate phosphatase